MKLNGEGYKKWKQRQTFKKIQARENRIRRAQQREATARRELTVLKQEERASRAEAKLKAMKGPSTTEKLLGTAKKYGKKYTEYRAPPPRRRRRRVRSRRKARRKAPKRRKSRRRRRSQGMFGDFGGGFGSTDFGF